MYQKPKGTRDILPGTSEKWQKMESVARDFARRFGYKEIRTPTFEETSLFLRSVGESSDIVSKEMYTFKDKADRSLTLRPEGTAGVVRAFVENGLTNLGLPQKLFYIGNNFRYENPQAGRYREHTQFGAESFGVDTPIGELEAINLAVTYLKELGIKGAVLHINSIGCPTCRKTFNDALRKFGAENEKSFCEDCQRRMKTNPMRMLDCKNTNCQELLKKAPKLKDYLCEDCKTHFNIVQTLLKGSVINFVVDENLVRGFDYYTKTVFEFVCENIDGKGTKLSIGGGGRYDNLVEEFGGPKTSCVGFGLGLDRVIMLLGEQKEELPSVYVLNVGCISPEMTYSIVQELRKNGIKTVMNDNNKSFKAQFKFAEKIDATYVLIVGDEELKSGVFTLKNQKTNQEQKLNLADVLKQIKKGE